MLNQQPVMPQAGRQPLSLSLIHISGLPVYPVRIYVKKPWEA